MKRLISEEEIIEFSVSCSDKIKCIDEYTNGLAVGIDVGVMEGVDFAEQKLKYLAIDYGLWIDNNYWSKHSIGGWFNTTNYSLMNNPLSSEQLFEKFLSTRK